MCQAISGRDNLYLTDHLNQGYWSRNVLAGLAMVALIDWVEIVNSVATSTSNPGITIIHHRMAI